MQTTSWHLRSYQRHQSAAPIVAHSCQGFQADLHNFSFWLSDVPKVFSETFFFYWVVFTLNMPQWLNVELKWLLCEHLPPSVAFGLSWHKASADGELHSFIIKWTKRLFSVFSLCSVCLRVCVYWSSSCKECDALRTANASSRCTAAWGIWLIGECFICFVAKHAVISQFLDWPDGEMFCNRELVALNRSRLGGILCGSRPGWTL